MLLIDNLKPLKIYRKPMFLPTVENDKKKKSAIMLLTPNYESSKSLMLSDLFINKLRFASYYIEKDLTYFISSKVMNKVDDVTETYVHNYNEIDFYQSLCEMSTSERNKLKDSDFGLPKKRKYPLIDKCHVKSAIKFFNYVDKDDEAELAKNIKSKMKKYNISSDSVGEKNRLKKYLTESIGSSIDTVVFDLGDVLIGHDYEKYLQDLHTIPDEFIHDIFITITTQPEEYYNRFETCSFGEGKRYFEELLGDKFKQYAEDTYRAYNECCYVMDYTEDLLSSLKDKDYKLYYLSNWSKVGVDTLRHNGVFDFLNEYFEGGIFSCNSFRKPDKRIYEELVHRYGLDPSRIIFFDDKRENIDAAKSCGWSAVQFTEILGRQITGGEVSIEDLAGNSSNNMVDNTSDSRGCVEEGFLFDQDDIYYNLDKFELGETNVCFITGYSGSGKTTMANTYKDAEIIHLDLVQQNYRKHSLAQMREMSEVMYLFFKGPGLKYKNPTTDFSWQGEDNRELINEFILFVLDYAKMHRDTKFIIEGMQLFTFVDPEILEDHAVFIKRTAALKSAYRAAKRDGINKGETNKLNYLKRMFSRAKYMPDNIRLLSNYINYFSEAAIDDIIIDKEWYYYSDEGVCNALVRIKGSNVNLRGRSEVLIIKDNKVFLDLKSHPGKIRIPGGGWEENEEHVNAAIREAEEEARIKCKNIKWYGNYIDMEKPNDWVNKLPEGARFQGKFTELYVAEYSGKYTGRIAKVDKDSMYTNGEWYDINTIIHQLKPKQQDALRDYINTVQEGMVMDNKDKFVSEIIHTSDNTLYNWIMKNTNYKSNGIYDINKIEKDHEGDCHDFAGYQYYWLKKLGYKTGRLFMVEYSRWNSPGGKTHTACWYVKDHKYYWMETAWGGMEGIHECGSSLSDVKNFIIKNWKFSGKNDKLYIGNVHGVKNGMTLNEYVNTCTPEKI